MIFKVFIKLHNGESVEHTVSHNNLVFGRSGRLWINDDSYAYRDIKEITFKTLEGIPLEHQHLTGS